MRSHRHALPDMDAGLPSARSGSNVHNDYLRSVLSKSIARPAVIALISAEENGVHYRYMAVDRRPT